MEIALWMTNIEPRIVLGRIVGHSTFTVIWAMPAMMNMFVGGFLTFKLLIKRQDACEHLVQGFAS